MLVFALTQIHHQHPQKTYLTPCTLNSINNLDFVEVVLAAPRSTSNRLQNPPIGIELNQNVAFDSTTCGRVIVYNYMLTDIKLRIGARKKMDNVKLRLGRA